MKELRRIMAACIMVTCFSNSIWAENIDADIVGTVYDIKTTHRFLPQQSI